MAKCKMCKANILEGKEYCEDCQDKASAKANESYLDSLLNSVKNTAPNVENRFKKKNSENDSNPDSYSKKNQETEEEQKSERTQKSEQTQNTELNQEAKINQKSELEEDDMFKVDLSDIEDFDQFYFEDDPQALDQHIIIGDEELFGEKLSKIFDQDNDSEEDNNLQTEDAKVVNDSITEEQPEQYDLIEEAMPDIEDSIETDLSDNQKNNFEDNDTITNQVSANNGNGNQETIIDETSEVIPDVEQVIETSSTQAEDGNINANEIFEFPEEDNIDLDLDELLNNLDSAKIQNDSVANSPEEDLFQTLTDENLVSSEELGSDLNDMRTDQDEFEQVEADDDDFLSLLNQMSSDDPATEDVRAINDMLGGKSVNERKPDNMPSNVGEVFSDALKVVSSLKDLEYDEDKILAEIPDKRKKKNKKSKNTSTEGEEELPNKVKNKKVKQKKEKSEESLFKRLFSNIKDEKSATTFSKEKDITSEPSAKTSKKSKRKNKKVAEQPEEDVDLRDRRPGKEKEPSKKESKKEKAANKKKSREIIQVIDEIDEDPGRINRLGALIVFLLFGVMAVIVILGSSVVSYTLSIQHATDYFGNRKYTQAYKEVYGVEIKDEDLEIYEKIMTVMFVNKQLNSYNNYYAMEKYPEALDALLKGLSRYEKYIELATIMGIETDLDYVRSQILAELNNEFNLTEQEAVQILDYDNMQDYSLEVYNVVLEKMNN